MKKFFRLLVLALCTMALTITAAVSLTACGGKSSSDTYEPIEGTVKIGVLNASTLDEGSEAAGFKTYLETMAPNYNFSIKYSPVITDTMSAKSEAEALVADGCKAIIDMAGKERVAIADYCEDEHIYYTVGTGVMTDADFEAVKTNHYFLGQIGPDSTAEYNAGKGMGEWFKGYCTTNSISNPVVSIYAGFTGMDPMHVYRLAGLLDGLGLKYNNKTGLEAKDEMGIAAVSTGLQASAISGTGITVNYMFGGYGGAGVGSIDNMPDGTQYLLGVSMNNVFHSVTCQQKGVKFTDIDSFGGWAAGNMASGDLIYEAGKLQSDLGPVLALIKQAVNGNPIRDNGNAVSISQGYHIATDMAAFGTNMETSGYVYSKTVLDTLIATTTVDAFKAAMQ